MAEPVAEERISSASDFVGLLWKLFLAGYACGAENGGETPGWKFDAWEQFSRELYAVFPSMVGVADGSTVWFCERRTATGWSGELHPAGIPGVAHETMGEVVVASVNGPQRLRRCFRVPLYLAGSTIGTIEAHVAGLCGE